MKKHFIYCTFLLLSFFSFGQKQIQEENAGETPYVAVDLASQSKLIFGKMIDDWGGYELLTNPIEILS